MILPFYLIFVYVFFTFFAVDTQIMLATDINYESIPSPGLSASWSVKPNRSSLPKALAFLIQQFVAIWIA